MALRKYPWEEWLGKPLTVLCRGLDYTISQASMDKSVRNNASMRGLRVRIEDTGDKLVIQVVGRVKDEVPHTNTPTILDEYSDALEENGQTKERPTISNFSLSERDASNKDADSSNTNAHRKEKARR